MSQSLQSPYYGFSTTLEWSSNEDKFKEKRKLRKSYVMSTVVSSFASTFASSLFQYLVNR